MAAPSDILEGSIQAMGNVWRVASRHLASGQKVTMSLLSSPSRGRKGLKTLRLTSYTRLLRITRQRPHWGIQNPSLLPCLGTALPISSKSVSQVQNREPRDVPTQCMSEDGE